ncbi:LOW QUALITY PROTEIN: tectonic-1 [Gastrophryne carolinensis]
MLVLGRLVVCLFCLEAASFYGTERPDSRDPASNEAEVWELLGNDTHEEIADSSPTGKSSPTEHPVTGGPSPTEHPGSSETGQLDKDGRSLAEQPGTVTTQPHTPDVTPSEGANTASEPPVLGKEPESSDTGQTRSVPVLAISVSSLCVCDLLVAQCDINCCCDADCTAADFSVFSGCSVSVVTGDNQLCSQEAVLYSISSLKVPQRVIETVEVINPNVFCIQKSNYQPALSYITPDEPTEANFDSLLTEFGENQFNTGSDVLNAVGSAEARNATRYEYGTSILTPDSYLKLPSPMGTKSCTDNNPIGFLSTQDLTCTRAVQLENCSVPAVTLETYTGVQILPVPNSQEVVNVTVQTITLQSIDGALIRGNFSNNAPFYNYTTGICTNVVLEGSYSVYYTDQGRITRVLASFILGAINTNTIQQTFQIGFIEEGTAPAPLSGNPGYVSGMPLVAGFKLPLSFLMTTNRFGQLTLLKSSIGQSCLTGDWKRTAVLFGLNTMSGCKLQLNFTGAAFCQLAADAALNALKGQQFPDYVAQFGNSQPENVQDWVPITLVSPTDQAYIQDMCKIPVSLELEVRWTKIGNLLNPQAQIVNVTKKITHVFIPNHVISGRTVQISSAVTFMDASQPASPGYKAQPTIDAKLPFDFFHPFV